MDKRVTRHCEQRDLSVDRNDRGVTSEAGGKRVTKLVEEVLRTRISF